MSKGKLKFYYSPGACSLAPHIILEEVGADYELIRVMLADGEQNTPAYRKLNPKGRVPVLVDGDFVLTENPAVLRYIADSFPEAGLWPQDPQQQARAAEWLAWFSSTVHTSYAHCRRPERYASTDSAKQEVIAKGQETCRCLWNDIEGKLEYGPFALGERFSVVDAYLMVFWNWGRTPALGYDMAKEYPTWTAHARRLAERPSVRRAFEQEKLELPA